MGLDPAELGIQIFHTEAPLRCNALLAKIRHGKAAASDQQCGPQTGHLCYSPGMPGPTPQRFLLEDVEEAWVFSSLFAGFYPHLLDRPLRNGGRGLRCPGIWNTDHNCLWKVLPLQKLGRLENPHPFEPAPEQNWMNPARKPATRHSVQYHPK